MASSEKKVDQFLLRLIICYIALIPFGQLGRFEISYLNFNIPILFFDLTALVLLISKTIFIKSITTPKYLISFLVIAVFSFIASFTDSFIDSYLFSFMYLLRLLSWGAVFLITDFIVRKNITSREKLKYYLYLGLLSACVIGLIQYFFYPDIRYLKEFGWDDHLNRLTGLYLDPGYMGLIALTGLFVSLSVYKKNMSYVSLGSYFIFFLTLLLTYSRATYLAFAFGVMFYLFKKFSKKALLYFSLIISFFITLIFLLPRPEGEGVRLERWESINQRFTNYSQTLILIKDHPLVGVGYNNICRSRLEYFGGDSRSHSCSGADSSLLFVFATTGILGIFVFIKLLYMLFVSLRRDTSVQCILISAIVHSMFSNSLFYTPFVGIFMILYAIAQRTKEKI